MFTFGVKGGYEAGVKLVEKRAAVLASRQYRRHAQPDPAPGLDHAPPAHRRAALAAGAGPDVVRLSIGLETADDLIRDLDEALTAST